MRSVPPAYTAMQHMSLFPKCYVILIYVFYFELADCVYCFSSIIHISHVKYDGLIMLSVHRSVTDAIITVSQRPTT